MPSSKNARLFYRAAWQRLDDARLLFDLERTTAAVYLGGYSVECMLKSLILAETPRNQEEQLLSLFRGRKAHDYDWLIGLYRGGKSAIISSTLVSHFVRVNTWSTDIRYSPGTIEVSEARTFLDSVVKINQWIDGRL